MVDGRPTVVLHLLPRLAGRPRSARVTNKPPCRRCEAPLHWQLPERRWRCSVCSDTPSTEQLAEWAREHRDDGGRAGREHRERRERRYRQVARGAPGAAVLLLRTAAAGGALSCAALIDGVSGAERRALRWAFATPAIDRCPPSAAERQPSSSIA